MFYDLINQPLGMDCGCSLMLLLESLWPTALLSPPEDQGLSVQLSMSPVSQISQLCERKAHTGISCFSVEPSPACLPQGTLQLTPAPGPVQTPALSCRRLGVWSWPQNPPHQDKRAFVPGSRTGSLPVCSKPAWLSLM